jgi:hypothetical protein
MKDFTIAVLAIYAMVGMAFGQQEQKKSVHDATEWKTVADRFMSELVGNRIDKARRRTAVMEQASCRSTRSTTPRLDPEP